MIRALGYVNACGGNTGSASGGFSLFGADFDQECGLPRIGPAGKVFAVSSSRGDTPRCGKMMTFLVVSWIGEGNPAIWHFRLKSLFRLRGGRRLQGGSFKRKRGFVLRFDRVAVAQISQSDIHGGRIGSNEPAH
jgi:hypothetical protein